MILGLNNNVPYKGKVFHIQTEDSGRQSPHIFTHLFHGGDILATKKVDYHDIVPVEGLEDIVRELMKEQHQLMIKELQGGTYDDKIAAFFKAEEKGAPPPKVQEVELRVTEKSLANKSLDEVILDYLSREPEKK